jgi:hypothetical protein
MPKISPYAAPGHCQVNRQQNDVEREHGRKRALFGLMDTDLLSPGPERFGVSPAIGSG